VYEVPKVSYNGALDMTTLPSVEDGT
jgi:hypothetical protein